MQKSLSPKVLASTVGAALAIIVCAILRGVGVSIDETVQGAIVIVLTFLLGYLRVDPARQ